MTATATSARCGFTVGNRRPAITLITFRFRTLRVAARFPEVPRGQFETAVQLVEPDGHVYGGAEAVFRALAQKPDEGWLLDWYEHSPVFARATEWGYRRVARNRGFFSALTRLAWGRHLDPPTYNLVRWVFLRSLGLIYLIAFRVPVGADHRPGRPQWHPASGIGHDHHAPGSGRATPRPGALPPGADAVLVQSDRRFPEVSMRCRDGAGRAPHRRHRPRPVPVPVVADLPLALARSAGSFWLSSGTSCCWRPASWRSSWHPCNCGPACPVPRHPRGWCSGCCGGCCSS